MHLSYWSHSNFACLFLLSAVSGSELIDANRSVVSFNRKKLVMNVNIIALIRSRSKSGGKDGKLLRGREGGRSTGYF